MKNFGSITDVDGIRVGHHHRLDPDARLGHGWASGSTVVMAPPATIGAVDVRGGAPGSRETDLLDPAASVRYVDAVVLTGGSAFGLAAADGVMQWLEEHNRGVVFPGVIGESATVVPIVPAAVIFDLLVGGWKCRPTAEFGYHAAGAASSDVAVGSVGAGVGARAGVLKGGVGTASVTVASGITVGGLVVVNCAGTVVNPATGLPWMAHLSNELGLLTPPDDQRAAFADIAAMPSPFNTTIAVVATNAALTPMGCRRVAIAAHDGLAHTIHPVHTAFDGDIVFALATGAVDNEPSASIPAAMMPESALASVVGAAAAQCLGRAVLNAVVTAQSVADIPTYRDILPGAFSGTYL